MTQLSKHKMPKIPKQSPAPAKPITPAIPKMSKAKVEEDINMYGWGFPEEGVYPYDIKSFGAAPVSFAAASMGVYPGTSLAEPLYSTYDYLHGAVEGPYDTDAKGLFPGLNLSG